MWMSHTSNVARHNKWYITSYVTWPPVTVVRHRNQSLTIPKQSGNHLYCPDVEWGPFSEFESKRRREREPRAWLHGMAGIPLPAPSLTLLLSALFGSLEEARKEGEAIQGGSLNCCPSSPSLMWKEGRNGLREIFRPLFWLSAACKRALLGRRPPRPPFRLRHCDAAGMACVRNFMQAWSHFWS